MKKKVGELKAKFESIKARGGLENEEVLQENPDPLVQGLIKRCLDLGDKDYHTVHGVHGTSLRRYRKRKKFAKLNKKPKVMKITIRPKSQ